MRIRQCEIRKSNDTVSKRWYRIWKVTALQACVQKWCGESILTALWFGIEWLIFDLKVKWWQSVISTVSVLCRLFETYIHQIWAFRSVKTAKSHLTLSLMIWIIAEY